jgi:hypothetical protein
VVQRCGTVNNSGPSQGRPKPIAASGAGTSDTVIHKFSHGSQGTLYPIKLFGIIVIVRALAWLSTVACPLYDECGGQLAQSFLGKHGTELYERRPGAVKTFAAFENRVELTRSKSNEWARPEFSLHRGRTGCHVLLAVALGLD